MPFSDAAYMWGFWIGLLGTIGTGMTALLNDDGAAQDMELSLLAISGAAATIAALVFLALGGITASAMFIGSAVVGVLVGIVLVQIIKYLPNVVLFLVSGHQRRDSIANPTNRVS